VKSLGAVPVSIASSEIYLALERGVIDGVLATPSTADSLKLTDFIKYALRLPFGYIVGIVHINANTWSIIPDDLKLIIEDAFGQSHEYFIQQFNIYDAKVNSTLTYQGGAIYTPSTSELTQWADTMKPIITQWITDMESEGLPAQYLVNTIRTESQQRGVPFPY
jgi:TRAP-type C4-dicarboxylate transport system substrate-binding protein